MQYLEPKMKIVKFQLEDVILVSGQCTEGDQCGPGGGDGASLSGSDEGNLYDGTGIDGSL